MVRNISVICKIILDELFMKKCCLKLNLLELCLYL